MSDFLTTLLIMIGVGLLFLVPSAFIGGKVMLTIVTLLLTGISCYLLLYGKALGKSFANSTTPTSIDLELVLLFLSFAALYTFIAYGSFCLKQATYGIDGYKIKLLIWFIILIGYPTYLSVSAALSLYHVQKKNYTTAIIIVHAIDFPVLIDRIKFFDSKTKKASSVSYRYHENDRKMNQIEGLSSDNEQMRYQRYYTQLSPTLIPIGFDSFELSWYSISESRFYRDTFPIDQKKLKIDENYDGYLTISDLLINILPDGNVDVLKREYTSYTHLGAYFDVAFTPVDGQSIDTIWKNHSQIDEQNINYRNLNIDFERLKAGTVRNLSPEEILSFRNVYAYGIDIELLQKEETISEFRDITVVDFYLNQYSRSSKFLKKISTTPLPSLIRVKHIDNKDQYHWVTIMFDKKELLKQFEFFTKTHKNEVSFKIVINSSALKKSTIWLQSNDDKIVLDNWSIIKR
ncbi:hypothetical protein EI427_21885 [Flammeovirga pectinis]|uniref:Uncharacterized protein n=1 Tax=Flammeovirga pectinis TaxID=2494373 RepID=A0A3Q9FQ05_9BACT|nr:hypothetical protein [Flammeovirga pectinis]AZQ64879.1 hypothetical protein EI427_21885 [Flammeovirga pectinis]